MASEVNNDYDHHFRSRMLRKRGHRSLLEANADLAPLTVIRLDWVHARAANARWREELLLLREEARRIVVTFEADSRQWASRKEDFDGEGFPEDVIRGYKAYCSSQSHVFDVLSSRAANVLVPSM